MTGRRASGAPPVAIFDEATALLGLDRRLSPHVIRAALAPPFIQTDVAAIEGRPLIGCGTVTSPPWDVGTRTHACQAPHPALPA